MTEDKARDRVESGDSERERNAVIRPQEPAADRMGFFNGLLWLPPAGRSPPTDCKGVSRKRNAVFAPISSRPDNNGKYTYTESS